MGGKDDSAKQIWPGGRAVGVIGVDADPAGSGILLSRAEYPPFITRIPRGFTRSRPSNLLFRESSFPGARVAARCSPREVHRCDHPRSEPGYSAWSPESRSR